MNKVNFQDTQFKRKIILSKNYVNINHENYSYIEVERLKEEVL